MSLTNKQLQELKPGDSIKVGALMSNLCPDEVHLDLHEKVDGALHFDATYMGISLGVVVYNKGKWGWGS